MKVCIVGTGYVGLTTGACLAFLGHEVTCVDNNEAKVGMLRAGRSPIHEPYLEDLLAEAGHNLTYTTSYAEAVPGADVVFIAVNTPSLPDGSPDLKYLSSAAEDIGRNLGPGFTVVVNKSTVPIGSGNWVDAILREAHTGEGEFSVASNPEFLREGAAISDSLYTDRVVVGSDDARSLEVLYTLYRPVLDQSFTAPPFLPRPEGMGAVPLVATDLASAELIKYAANAFLALKISFINEIGQVAGKVGADIIQVAKGTGLDSRIGSRFLQPGVGWGGSCFGKDTAALITTAREYNLDMPIVQASRDTNRRQRELVVDKLLDELRILKGRTIGLLGLAFKPNTDDLRDAPALDIARRLIERGAKVRLHDPVAMARFREEQPDLAPYLCDTAEAVAESSDALVLVTEWPQYLEMEWAKLAVVMRKPIVLDGRHVLDESRLTRAGFRYLALAGWR
ncbi:UDP-glucose dehydrogenase family protein [Longispora albida]|uniref:UDP-glucose dehydrogenase family protein n=1 Tax=Longispora albida TaxID=203523 RepID=UPI00035CB700|nr:UDP-glucose/GDP-mannose dehydrogenase family protein [Longispora albida]